MSLSLVPGLSAAEVVERDLPAGTATAIGLGPATRGFLVTTPYRLPGGAWYEATTYLAETPRGTFRIDRYEEFDWPSFDAVARSFHFIEVVD